MRAKLFKMLCGGDLHSIGKANLIADEITNQDDFDVLFEYLYSDNRLIVMRVADAIEKITVESHEFLYVHKSEIFEFCKNADNIEFRWHLALLLPRLSLSADEFAYVWELLSSWLHDPAESRIVRVNSIQALFELSQQDLTTKEKLYGIMNEMEQEKIPSLLARIRKIRRKERL